MPQDLGALFAPSVATLVVAYFFAVFLRRLLVLLFIADFIGRLPPLAPYIIIDIPMLGVASKCFHFNLGGSDLLQVWCLILVFRRPQTHHKPQGPLAFERRRYAAHLRALGFYAGHLFLQRSHGFLVAKHVALVPALEPEPVALTLKTIHPSKDPRVHFVIGSIRPVVSEQALGLKVTSSSPAVSVNIFGVNSEL